MLNRFFHLTVVVELKAERAEIRNISSTREAEIDACTTIEELEALMKAPVQLYDEETDTYSPNPAAMTQWPLSEEV